MDTVTLHANDSASALDLVQQKFGDDALILSMQTGDDGTVTIVASADDVSTPTNQVAPPRRPIDIVVGDDMSETQSVPTAQTPPAKKRKAPRLPSFLRRDTATNAALEPTPETHAEQTTTSFAETLKLAEDKAAAGAQVATAPELTARRVVIVGPSGAGKSLAALQLAALRLKRDPDTRPRVIYCGNGSHSDAGFLFQKGHLLGLKIEIRQPEMINDPQSGEFQVIVVTGRGGPGPDRMRPLIQTADAHAIIVLPAGLRKDRIIGLSGQWGTDVATVILSADPEFPATQADSDEITAAGLVHIWNSDSARIVNGLTPARQPEPTVPVANPAEPNIVFRHSARRTSETAEGERST